jgi:hypothetical protein
VVCSPCVGMLICCWAACGSILKSICSGGTGERYRRFSVMFSITVTNRHVICGYRRDSPRGPPGGLMPQPRQSTHPGSCQALGTCFCRRFGCRRIRFGGTKPTTRFSYERDMLLPVTLVMISPGVIRCGKGKGSNLVDSCQSHACLKDCRGRLA